ncbi:hypothetical protein TNCV_2930151, partial [Trichonephila clavipes]
IQSSRNTVCPEKANQSATHNSASKPTVPKPTKQVENVNAISCQHLKTDSKVKMYSTCQKKTRYSCHASIARS